MIAFNKILFPVDFSERCRGAAHYVESMAANFGSKLILLHVLDILAPAVDIGAGGTMFEAGGLFPEGDRFVVPPQESKQDRPLLPNRFLQKAFARADAREFVQPYRVRDLFRSGRGIAQGGTRAVARE